KDEQDRLEWTTQPRAGADRPCRFGRRRRPFRPRPRDCPWDTARSGLAGREELREPGGVRRRERLVLVLEVDVEADARVEQRPEPLRPFGEGGLVVRRLAQAQVAKRRVTLERAFELDAS